MELTEWYGMVSQEQRTVLPVGPAIHCCLAHIVQ